MMAVQAALTGHLVFSTPHTNDAASAVTRMMDLGIEPYFVLSHRNLLVPRILNLMERLVVQVT